jgi:hypothetical protein
MLSVSGELIGRNLIISQGASAGGKVGPGDRSLENWIVNGWITQDRGPGLWRTGKATSRITQAKESRKKEDTETRTNTDIYECKNRTC